MSDLNDQTIEDTPKWAESLKLAWRCTAEEAQTILDILFERVNAEQLNNRGQLPDEKYSQLVRSGATGKTGDHKLQLIHAMPGLGDGTYDVDEYVVGHIDRENILYLNTGDLCSPTIAFIPGEDTEDGDFLLTTLGDLREDYESTD